MNNNQDVHLTAMQTDDEHVHLLPFPISEALALKMDDQRQKLSHTDPELPGKQRYLSAREHGCFAAVAKGAKDRELQPGRIFIPGSELTHSNGRVRISALKASLPVPDGLHVKGITFTCDDTGWRGQLEVKEVAAA